MLYHWPGGQNYGVCLQHVLLFSHKIKIILKVNFCLYWKLRVLVVVNLIDFRKTRKHLDFFF